MKDQDVGPAIREGLALYHAIHRKYAAAFVQLPLLIGYLMADVYALTHLQPMGIFLTSPLAGFGLLWLGVMGLAVGPGREGKTRWIGAMLALLAAVAFYGALILTIQVLLPPPAYEHLWVVALALGATLVTVLATLGWARASLGVGMVAAIGMALHPLVHVSGVALVVWAVRRFL